MEPMLVLQDPWRELLALLLAATGGAELWHGMLGQPDGEGGLARRRTTLPGRIKGFQHVVSGLMLIGFATALVFAAPWLVYLALGFGFVELRESNMLLAALRGPAEPSPAHPRPTARPITAIAASP
jgi:hypothetical protein